MVGGGRRDDADARPTHSDAALTQWDARRTRRDAKGGKASGRNRGGERNVVKEKSEAAGSVRHENT